MDGDIHSSGQSAEILPPRPKVVFRAATEREAMTNLWEDLETGPNPPEEIYAVVECLKGERNKYEYDKDLPGVVLDRVLHSNVHYPSDYG
ncbi:MAG: inorganic pyrophosphatase, partial [Natronomonas sp.]